MATKKAIAAAALAALSSEPMTNLEESKTVKKISKDDDAFTQLLITALNKEHGSKVAYNLSCEDSPTNVYRWISTGSRQLDYIIRNARDGGLPEGRIVEIFGPPSIGKSHIAIQIARSTQKMGGIVVYIDSESATSVENLSLLGVNISKRFVYVDAHCTEDVLAIAESTILKAKAMNKDVPVTIIWDSIASSSPKAELDGDYDQNSIGLQARALSKGMRKIVGVIANQRVLFVALNQVRTAIGVMHADPTVVPGGRAVPFAASVRIKLGAGQKIEDKNKNVIGINVSAQTIKNKVAIPFRKCEFEIHFGVGIKEHEQIFDVFRALDKVVYKNKQLWVEGLGAWKTFTVTDLETGEVYVSEKFYKPKFDKILDNPAYAEYMDFLFDKAFLRKLVDLSDVSIDPESYTEVQALANLLEEDSSME